MKVLHVLAQLPLKTGSGVYFTNVIEGLKEYKNVEQASIYATTKEYDINILEKSKQYEVVFESDELPFSIVGMSDIMPYRNTLYSEMTEEMIVAWQNVFREKLLKIREEFNPDKIITHHLWILSSIVCEVFKDKKIIAICHNTDIRQAEKNIDFKEKYIKNFDKIDKVFSLSSFQFDDITKIFCIPKEKIINIGAGYNEKIFYPLEKYKDKKNVDLIYAGKFDESKGFYELIKAFRVISEKRNNVNLTLIGDVNDENREKIQDLTQNLKNLEIYNVKNQKELGNVIREKDVFILPSYFEGLGLIAVEALGSGLRAVTTNIAGLMEFLGETVNKSELIEYVEMPTIYDVDKAVEAEKPEFVQRLAKTIEIQIDRTLQKREIPKEMFEEIEKHSWKAKIGEIYKVLE